MKVRLQPFLTIDSRRVFLEVAVLIFHSSPQPLDHHIINRPAFAIHTDRDRRLLQPLREFATRELRTLVRIEDLRSIMLQRLVQLFETFEFGLIPRTTYDVDPNFFHQFQD